MAITKSAKKALRSSMRKRAFNLRRKRRISEVTKRIRKLIAEKKTAEALALLPAAYQAIDKAAKTNFLHKRAAARKKSRLAAAIARVEK
ncbi:MAG: 30S ribosomal protein S20 [Candidatus Taylorbacteria bacterium]|nr:30S ribosomal protein S20 [Candidatus Taylorbacteria bacterium]